MNLIRSLLFFIEGFESHLDLELRPDQISDDPKFKGYSNDAIAHHIRLLVESGLVKGTFQVTESGHGLAMGINLTWQGHDFIESARSDTVWNKTQDVAKRAGGVTFNVFVQVLAKTAADHMKQFLN